LAFLVLLVAVVISMIVEVMQLMLMVAMNRVAGCFADYEVFIRPWKTDYL